MFNAYSLRSTRTWIVQDDGAAVFGQACRGFCRGCHAAPRQPQGHLRSATTAADSIVAAAAADQDAKIAAAENAIDEADQLAELGAYADAAGLLNAASASLTLNTSTADVLDDLEDAKAASF